MLLNIRRWRRLAEDKNIWRQTVGQFRTICGLPFKNNNNINIYIYMAIPLLWLLIAVFFTAESRIRVHSSSSGICRDQFDSTRTFFPRTSVSVAIITSLTVHIGGWGRGHWVVRHRNSRRHPEA